MNSGNNQNAFIEAVKNKPVVSTLCAAWLPVAAVTGGVLPIDSDVGANIMAGLLYSAPVLCATATAIGAANLVRHKSLLSKPFSAVAVGAGVVAALSYRQGVNDGGVAEALSYLLSGTFATAGGVANIVSHYTRDLGPKIGITKPDTPSV